MVGKAGLGFIEGVLIDDETYLLIDLVGKSLKIFNFPKAFFDCLPKLLVGQIEVVADLETLITL